MRKALLFIVPFILLFAAGCSITLHAPDQFSEHGSGRLVSEQRDVSGFDKVVFGSFGDLSITQGEQESLIIEADDNLLEHIESNVVNGVLSLGFELNYHFVLPTHIHYTLVVKDLSSIQLSGVGSVEIGELHTGSLSMDLSGTGNLTVANLRADRLNVVISGLGGVEAAGKVRDLDIHISGAGNFKGGSLHSQTSHIRVSGLGDATVWVDNSLDVVVSGTGGIEYYGRPQISQTISGLGDLKSLGNK